MNSYYSEFNEKGLGFFGGFYQTSALTHILHLFIFVFYEFYFRKVWSDKYSSLNKLVSYKLVYFSSFILNKMSEQFRIIESPLYYINFFNYYIVRLHLYIANNKKSLYFYLFSIVLLSFNVNISLLCWSLFGLSLTFVFLLESAYKFIMFSLNKNNKINILNNVIYIFILTIILFTILCLGLFIIYTILKTNPFYLKSSSIDDSSRNENIGSNNNGPNNNHNNGPNNNHSYSPFSEERENKKNKWEPVGYTDDGKSIIKSIEKDVEKDVDKQLLVEQARNKAKLMLKNGQTLKNNSSGINPSDHINYDAVSYQRFEDWGLDEKKIFDLKVKSDYAVAAKSMEFMSKTSRYPFNSINACFDTSLYRMVDKVIKDQTNPHDFYRVDGSIKNNKKIRKILENIANNN